MVYGNFNYTLLGEIVRRIAGTSLEEFARERLFEPLGMTGTSYTMRDDMRERLLGRAREAPLSENFVLPGTPGMLSEEWRAMQDGGAGLHACAMDVAVFGQMHLNRGRYGDVRILSPAGASAMSRDQIPGIRAQFFDMPERDANYGYGWIIQSNECWRYMSATLPAMGSYSHPGAGGISFWVDPVNEIVGVYFEVTTQITQDLEAVTWSYDFFQNVITSAVDD